MRAQQMEQKALTAKEILQARSPILFTFAQCDLTPHHRHLNRMNATENGPGGADFLSEVSRNVHPFNGVTVVERQLVRQFLDAIQAFGDGVTILIGKHQRSIYRLKRPARGTTV